MRAFRFPDEPLFRGSQAKKTLETSLKRKIRKHGSESVATRTLLLIFSFRF
jgi:hypothetical protein